MTEKETSEKYDMGVTLRAPDVNYPHLSAPPSAAASLSTYLKGTAELPRHQGKSRQRSSAAHLSAVQEQNFVVVVKWQPMGVATLFGGLDPALLGTLEAARDATFDDTDILA
jgi:hypothetical protein